MPEFSVLQKAGYGLSFMFNPTKTSATLNKLPDSVTGTYATSTNIGVLMSKGLSGVTNRVSHLPGSDAYEIEILARTLWGEARGESSAGREAVANVIVNRAKQKKSLFGMSISQVCLKPLQFSCWNPKFGYSKNDPQIMANYKAMTRPLDTMQKDAIFVDCYNIATYAVKGQLRDNTGGADHYYAKGIATPSWAKGKKLASIGNHYFLNA